jgi:hypothetical protein
MPVPEHVFVSHSTRDAEFAQELCRELENADIPVWVDTTHLVPGTPDWEAAIRDGMARSFAVVVMASPDARASTFVRAEVMLAEALAKPIVPVWVSGEKWIDCAPLVLSQAQYIDLRGDARSSGVPSLVDSLRSSAARLAPKHYLVEPLWNIDRTDGQQRATRSGPPRGYLSVELSRATVDTDARPFQEAGRAAYFRVAAYESVTDLLDVLFIEYLSGQFEPYSYSREWVLREDRHFYCSRVLAQWEWLENEGRLQDNRVYRYMSLQSVGMTEGSSWRVSAVGTINPVGLAVHDVRLLRALERSPKTRYALESDGILSKMPIRHVPVEIAHRLVVVFERSWATEVPTGMALVQVVRDSPELSYWLR